MLSGSWEDGGGSASRRWETPVLQEEMCPSSRTRQPLGLDISGEEKSLMTLLRPWQTPQKGPILSAWC